MTHPNSHYWQGQWTSQDNNRVITCKAPTHSGYVEVTEYNKQTKHRQTIKVGADGFDQFVDQLIDGKWKHTTRQRRR
jgi:hypothetical protein